MYENMDKNAIREEILTVPGVQHAIVYGGCCKR